VQVRVARGRRGQVLLGLFFLAITAFSAAGFPVKRVLILHSIGRDFAPFNAIASNLRTDLAQQSPGPIEFYEAALETARFGDAGAEAAMLDYLRALFVERRLDLVVPVGDPAAHFWVRHRQQLFPDTPMLVAGMDQRTLQDMPLTERDVLFMVRHDLPGTIDHILRLLPDTKNIAVILGSSPLEKYWLEEARRDFEPFTDRVTFTWFNDLSFEQMRQRVAVLPQRSAIIFGLLNVDAAGIPHEQDKALASLHAVANAPMFAFHDHEFGLGIVGGPLISLEELSREAAAGAVRILSGEPVASIRPPVFGPGTPVYDWRELQRWHIVENSLPAGSIVRFRALTVWEQYRAQIIGALARIFHHQGKKVAKSFI
jgi:hypothetical protein